MYPTFSAIIIWVSNSDVEPNAMERNWMNSFVEFLDTPSAILVGYRYCGSFYLVSQSIDFFFGKFLGSFINCHNKRNPFFPNLQFFIILHDNTVDGA